MELTGYLDFWFRDAPIVERIARFHSLGIRRLDVWLWRERPMEEIHAECRRLGMLINSTFDGECGNLVDRTDHERCLQAWDETLEMAVRYGIPHLFVFSNQIDVSPRGEWVQRLNRDYTAAEMYANLLDGIERVM